MPRIAPIKVGRPMDQASRSREAGELAALPNLGPKTSGWLEATGIRTRTALARLGPIEACRKIMQAGQPVSVLLAYAIEGGLMGCHWNALPFETKQWLSTEFAQMKRELTNARRGRQTEKR